MAWTMVFAIIAVIFVGFHIYHRFALPRPAEDVSNRSGEENFLTTETGRVDVGHVVSHGLHRHTRGKHGAEAGVHDGSETAHIKSLLRVLLTRDV